MGESSEWFAQFSQLVEGGRPREAFLSFLDNVSGRPWTDLSAPQLRALDLICQRVIPELLEHHALWLVNRPDQLRQMLDFLLDALRVNYRPPTTLDQIAWFRCLLAISEAMSGRTDQVHEELSSVHGEAREKPSTAPNGEFHKQIEALELTEGAASAYLRPFFSAYTESLRRMGQHELAGFVENRIGKLLGLIARDETRPGIVQALLFVRGQSGHGRFVHVSLEKQQEHEDKKKDEGLIIYARRDTDRLDATFQDAALFARHAADGYFRRAGYPDGLEERAVRWEVASLRGDVENLQEHYAGGSIALPLAIAIISEYLGTPVPNDVAMTGALAAIEPAEGRVMPVDGVREKVEHALRSGSRLIYVPLGNVHELDEHPATKSLLAEHNARVVPVERVDEVCRDLFPPEGSGRLLDALKDTGANVLRTLHLLPRPKESRGAALAHARHWFHILACSVLTALLVFVEGWVIYKGFAPAYSLQEAWVRILLSAGLVLLGMLVALSLPDAFLRHRFRWSWFGGMVVQIASLAGAFIILQAGLPDVVVVSRTYFQTPAAGLLKDLFVFWLFMWVIAANTYNAVAALEHLISKRQYVTARDCLGWDTFLESRMPIRCVPFPWKWGALALAVVAVVLMQWELWFYGSLDSSKPGSPWLLYLGMARDVLLILAATEVMVFYKAALAEVRGALT